jgi:hypothetical protein
VGDDCDRCAAPDWRAATFLLVRSEQALSRSRVARSVMRSTPATSELGAIAGSLSGAAPTTALTDQVARVNQEMRELATEEAAGLLGVSSDVLRRWEHRFDYPCPKTCADGERIYVYWQIAALRDALTRELSITSAIRAAQHVRNQSCDAAPEARRAAAESVKSSKVAVGCQIQ